MSEQRILIVGAGAVGSYVGGYLARSGEDVTLIDPWPAHVERMREKGLRLAGLTDAECFETAVQALHLTDVQRLARERPIDIAFLCVKSYDTAWATMLIKDYLAPTGFVVSLQNCINEETIADIVGWGRTVGCVAGKLFLELNEPGEVTRSIPLGGGDEHTVFLVGEVHGRTTPRVEAVARLLSVIDSAGVTSNLWGERWSKLIANAMRNGVCAATGMSGNECSREPVTRRLSIRLGGEAVRVGQALGYELETINGFSPGAWMAALDGDVKVLDAIEASMLDTIEGRRESHRPSMGQDMIKGRRTEIDHINGLVARKGAQIGVPTPANSGLVEVVKRVERGEAQASLELVRSI